MCLLALTWLSLFLNSLIKTFFFVIDILSICYCLFLSFSTSDISLSTLTTLWNLFLLPPIKAFDICSDQRKWIFWSKSLWNPNVCTWQNLLSYKILSNRDQKVVQLVFATPFHIRYCEAWKGTTVPHHTQCPGHQPILHQSETFTDQFKSYGIVNCLFFDRINAFFLPAVWMR